MRTSLRLHTVLPAVLGVLAAMLLSAAPAAAHAALVSSDPPEGARLATAPTKVTLTFNEELAPEFSALAVTGPDGRAHTRGAAVVSGRELSAGLDGLGPAGTYTVAYRVVSADGHPVAGQYTFELTVAAPVPTSVQPPPATTTPVAAPDGAADDGGIPVWPLVAAAAALLAILGVIALRRGRSGR